MASVNLKAQRSAASLVGLVCVVLIGLTTPVSAQQEIDASKMYLGVTGSVCVLSTGSGSPEGVVTGSVCDQYYDTTAGQLWRKTSGTATNTGWQWHAAQWAYYTSGVGSYNVLYYGATGDGSDQTAAIQAAIDAAAASGVGGNYGGVVVIPQGDYLVTDTIDVPESVTIIGYGAGTTLGGATRIISEVPNGQPTFWIASRDVKMEGLQIERWATSTADGDAEIKSGGYVTGLVLRNLIVVRDASTGTCISLAMDGNEQAVPVASITRSGSTATVTTEWRHGMSANVSVMIDGADQAEYNGTFTVASVVSPTSYTYTVTGTPASPATGTIVSQSQGNATYVAILDNVRTGGGAYGIDIGRSNTSTSIRASYANGHAQSGMRLRGTYITCDACASDTNLYGYEISDAASVSLIGSGAETNARSGVWIDDSAGVSLIGFRSYANLYQLPTKVTAALAGAGAGNVDAGTHSYRVVFQDATGESVQSDASTVVTTTAGDGQVSLTGIPTGPSGTTLRRLYRTKAGGSVYYSLATLSNDPDADPSTPAPTTYTDNIADSALGNPMVSAALAGAGAGNVDEGTHVYRVTFVDANGNESYPLSLSQTVTTTAGDGKVNVTVPVGRAGTTARKIYRSKANETLTYSLDSISDNSTTEYVDNTADSGLSSAFETMWPTFVDYTGASTNRITIMTSKEDGSPGGVASIGSSTGLTNVSLTVIDTAVTTTMSGGATVDAVQLGLPAAAGRVTADNIYANAYGADENVAARFLNSHPSGFVRVEIERSSEARYGLLKYVTTGSATEWWAGLAYKGGLSNTDYTIGSSREYSDRLFALTTAGDLYVKGSVAIKTTELPTWTLFDAEDVTTPTFVLARYADSSYLFNNAYYNAAYKLRAPGYAHGIKFDTTSGDMLFNVTPAGGIADDTVSFVTGLTLDKDGNVTVHNDLDAAGTGTFGDVHVDLNNAGLVQAAKFENSHASGSVHTTLDRSGNLRYALTQYSTNDTPEWWTGLAYKAGVANTDYSIGITANWSEAALILDQSGNLTIANKITAPTIKLTTGATSGYILVSDADGDGTWTAPGSVSVDTATNLAGGAAGSVPYQTAPSTTTFLAIGAANTVMTSSGSAPQWSTALTLAGALSATTGTFSGSVSVDSGVLLVDAANNKVGINNATPAAALAVGDDLAGSTVSTLFTVQGGALGGTAGNTTTLGSLGFLSNNASSLAVRAHRTASGTGWDTTAITLGMDVDSSASAGGYLSFYNGRVGILTTTPSAAFTVGADKFTVSAFSGNTAAAGTFSATSGTFTGLLQSTLTTEQMRLRYDATNYVSHTVNSAGDYTIATTGTVAANADIILSPGGNVGIGTTNPLQKLAVEGALAVRPSNARYFTPSAPLHVFGNSVTARTDSTVQEILILSQSNTFSGSKGSHFGIGLSFWEDPGNNYPRTRVDFRTSGRATDTESTALTVMSLRDDGNVGIGTTSPTYQLQVNAGTNTWISAAQIYGTGADMGLSLNNTGTSGRNYVLMSNNSSSGVAAGSFRIYDGTAGADRIVVNSSGNVGIGTTSPDKALEINHSTGANLRLTYNDSANYADFSMSSGGNLTVAPTGDLYLNPTGNDVLPTTNYDINLGSLSAKYLALHVAELWAETLVAQNTIATIGGRILVGPTTTLCSDLAAGATTIYTKHNEMANGDRVYMEANSKVEFMAIASAASASGCGYAYTVTRNLDGTGANDWYAGDAIFNTGTTGEGFIDVYSVRGVKAATEYGPSITGNERQSTTYNDWETRWAIGNLNGVYGYSATAYGAGFGDPSATNLVIDSTNGIRFRNSATVLGQLTSSTWTLGSTASEHVAISSTAVQIKDGATVYTDLTAGVLSLGLTTAEHVLVNTTGVSLKDNTSVYGVFAATTTIGVTTEEHLSLTSSGIQFKNSSTVNGSLAADVWTLGQTGAEHVLINTSGLTVKDNTTTLANFGATVTIGQVAASQSNVYITAGALSLRNNATERIKLNADGSGFLANSNISWDTSGNLTVAANATIGGWSVNSTSIYATYAKLSSNSGSGYVSFGATPPTTYGNNVGAWLGYSSAAKMSLYYDANNYLQWDGTALYMKGAAGKMTLSPSGLSLKVYSGAGLDTGSSLTYVSSVLTGTPTIGVYEELATGSGNIRTMSITNVTSGTYGGAANHGWVNIAGGDGSAYIRLGVSSGSSTPDDDGMRLNAALTYMTGTAAVVGNFGVSATSKMYLDGVGLSGDSYIVESASNVVDLYAGGTKALSLTTSGGVFAGSVDSSGTFKATNASVTLTTGSANGDVILTATGTGSVVMNTNGTRRMTVYDSGGITIGSTNTDPASAGVLEVYPATSSYGIYVYGYNSTGNSFGFITKAGTNSSDYSFVNQSRAGTNYMYVRGDGYTWANVDWTIGSDRSFKKNIAPLTVAVARKALAGLRPSRYEMADDRLPGTHYGLIAQDVQSVIPDIVSVDSDGNLGIRYGSLLPFLIAATQGTQQDVTTLQAEVETLRAELAALKALLLEGRR